MFGYEFGKTNQTNIGEKLPSTETTKLGKFYSVSGNFMIFNFFPEANMSGTEFIISNLSLGEFLTELQMTGRNVCATGWTHNNCKYKKHDEQNICFDSIEYLRIIHKYNSDGNCLGWQKSDGI